MYTDAMSQWFMNYILKQLLNKAFVWWFFLFNDLDQHNYENIFMYIEMFSIRI